MYKLNELNAGQVLGREEMKKIMAGSGSTNCVLCYGSSTEPPEFYHQTYQGQDPNQFCRTRGPYPSGTWGQCY